MQITFERSGGIMGRKLVMNVNVHEIPAEEAENLRLLLADANFFSLADDLPDSPIPDGFSYAITVTTDKLTHTVHTTDMGASLPLRALVQELSTRARTQRKPV